MTNLQRGAGGSWTEESPVTNDLPVSVAHLLNRWRLYFEQKEVQCITRGKGAARSADKNQKENNRISLSRNSWLKKKKP